ncbi:MAG: hypothetical protein KBG26_05225 [Bacteroidales bacterium]|nr:hypothetical protein [Bacteroidales bacterium]
MNSFVSFTDAPPLRLLRFAADAIDGIEKGLIVFYQMPGNKLIAQSVERNHDEGWEVRSVLVEDFYEFFRSERQRKGAYQWLGKDDLPFEVHNQAFSHTIFDEFDRTILLLRFLDETNQGYDLLYLYFNPRFKSAFLSSEKQSFSTSEKALTAQILHRLLATFLVLMREERESFGQLMNNTRQLANRFQNERNKTELLEKQAGQSLVEYSKDILNELACKYNRKALLSPEAETLIRNFSGKLSHLKELLTNAFHFSLILNEPNQELMIQDWHMDIEKSPLKSDKRRKEKYEHLGRTGDLLNRLEFAARSVLNDRLPLTGKNVGSHCDKPISAPAISDVLKKHRSEIIALFEQYPDQWPIIRKDFAPIRNILIASGEKGKNLRVG